jgi:hypothetical protein
MVDRSRPVLDVEIDPGRRFAKYFAEVTKSVKDLSFSMGESARIIKKFSTANFILKGSGKYEPLSDDYAKRKRKLAPGTPILVGAKPGGGISGKLRDSLLGTTPDSVLNIGKISLIIGTKAKSRRGKPYPVYVQEGTTNPDGTTKMPAREHWFLTDKMVEQIFKTVDTEIARIWKTGK